MEREMMREGKPQSVLAALMLLTIIVIVILDLKDVQSIGFVLGGEAKLQDYHLFVGRNLSCDIFSVLWKVLPIIPILYVIEVFVMNDDRNKYLLCNLTSVINIAILMGHMLIVTIISKTVFLEYMLFLLVIVFTIAVLVNNIKSYKSASEQDFPRGNGKSMPYIIMILVVWFLWLVLNVYHSVIAQSKNYTYDSYIEGEYSRYQSLLEAFIPQELSGNNEAELVVIYVNLFNKNGNTYTTEELEEAIQQMIDGEGIPDVLKQFDDDYCDNRNDMDYYEFDPLIKGLFAENGISLNQLTQQELEAICEKVYSDVMNKQECDISNVIPDDLKITFMVEGQEVLYHRNTKITSQEINDIKIGCEADTISNAWGVPQEWIQTETGSCMVYSVENKSLAVIKLDGNKQVIEVIILKTEE